MCSDVQFDGAELPSLPTLKNGSLVGRYELVLAGIDTFCVVLLNDMEVGRTNNMHIPFHFDVTHELKPHGTNTLSLQLTNAIDGARAVASSPAFADPECKKFPRTKWFVLAPALQYATLPVHGSAWKLCCTESRCLWSQGRRLWARNRMFGLRAPAHWVLRMGLLEGEWLSQFVMLDGTAGFLTAVQSTCCRLGSDRWLPEACQFELSQVSAKAKWVICLNHSVENLADKN